MFVYAISAHSAQWNTGCIGLKMKQALQPDAAVTQ